MEIPITDEIRNLDSGLIQHLLLDEEAKTIFINPEYLDIFKIIKKNKTIYVDFKDIEKTTRIVQGLAYFDNKKIFDNLLTKIAKYIREKYINRKKTEKFLINHITHHRFDRCFILNNPFLTEDFLLLNYLNFRPNFNSLNYPHLSS